MHLTPPTHNFYYHDHSSDFHLLASHAEVPVTAEPGLATPPHRPARRRVQLLGWFGADHPSCRRAWCAFSGPESGSRS